MQLVAHSSRRISFVTFLFLKGFKYHFPTYVTIDLSETQSNTKYLPTLHVVFSDTCTDVADVKPLQEEEEREDNSFSGNEMPSSECVMDLRKSTHPTHRHTQTQI